jgi:hypothetical protein
MGVPNPEEWVKNVERLYRANDAEGVAALYLPTAQTRVGSEVKDPAWVQRHPHEWFDSLTDYEITRTFRAATKGIIVSETAASYVIKAEGRRYREFGADVYWVNNDGRILHKHTTEIVEPFIEGGLVGIDEACRFHGGRNG